MWIPNYQKKVELIQILKIKVLPDDTAVVTPVDPSLHHFDLTSEHLEENPREGGYWCISQDGSESFVSEEQFKAEFSPL